MFKIEFTLHIEFSKKSVYSPESYNSLFTLNMVAKNKFKYNKYNKYSKKK